MQSEVCGAAVAPRDIPGAVEGIQRQVDILTKIVDELYIKIEPAMRPSLPPPSGSKPIESSLPNRAPVAEQLHGSIARLITIRGKLDDVCSRLQL